MLIIRTHLPRIWRSELRARVMELGGIAQPRGSDTNALREEKWGQTNNQKSRIPTRTSSHKCTMAGLVIFLRISMLSNGDLFTRLDRPYDKARELPTFEQIIYSSPSSLAFATPTYDGIFLVWKL